MVKVKALNYTKKTTILYVTGCTTSDWHSPRGLAESQGVRMTFIQASHGWRITIIHQLNLIISTIGFAWSQQPSSGHYTLNSVPRKAVDLKPFFSTTTYFTIRHVDTSMKGIKKLNLESLYQFRWMKLYQVKHKKG